MHYVYYLRHQNNKEFYYGYSNDLERRLKEHQRKDRNWTLVYYEAYRAESDARRRERALKHYGQARTHLKNRAKDSLQKK